MKKEVEKYNERTFYETKICWYYRNFKSIKEEKFFFYEEEKTKTIQPTILQSSKEEDEAGHHQQKRFILKLLEIK